MLAGHKAALKPRILRAVGVALPQNFLILMLIHSVCGIVIPHRPNDLGARRASEFPKRIAHFYPPFDLKMCVNMRAMSRGF